jgi:hypothetical protein
MHRRALVAIILTGFVLRVAWILFAARTPVGAHDPSFYMLYGDRIARGFGYTTPAGAATAYYPVGYPAVLGAAFWVAHRLPGDHLLGAALGVNLLAGTATIGLVGVMGERILNRRAGLAAAAIIALLPNFIFHTATVLTETVFNSVLAAALLVLCWRPWSEPWTTRRVAGAGALLAVAALIRPVVLVLIPVVVVGWWLADRRALGAVARRAGVLAGVLLLVLTPWLVRNWAASGRPTLAASTGDNLCIGNNPDAQGGFNLSPYCFGDIDPEQHITGTNGRDGELTARAVRWARSNVGREPWLVWRRTYYTFENDHDGVRVVQSYEDDPWLQASHADLLANVADAAYVAVLVLAGIGAVLLLRRHREPRTLFLLAAAAGMVVAVWPFFGDVRFHVPVVLILTVPAGWTLARVAAR